MKKFFYIVSIIVVLAFTVVNIYVVKKSEVQLSETALANVEALASGENSGNTVDCYSSSDYKKGSTYYDCGTCTKQINSIGTGSTRTCIVR